MQFFDSSGFCDVARPRVLRASTSHSSLVSSPRTLKVTLSSFLARRSSRPSKYLPLSLSPSLSSLSSLLVLPVHHGPSNFRARTRPRKSGRGPAVFIRSLLLRRRDENRRAASGTLTPVRPSARLSRPVLWSFQDHSVAFMSSLSLSFSLSFFF